MVLIARLDDGRSLYAVEREDRGLYVLCQLGSWVNLQQLRAMAVASKLEIPKTTVRSLGETRDNVVVPLITPEVSKYMKKKRLAIEAIQSMVKRPSSALLTDSQPPAVDPESTPCSQHEEHTSTGLTLNDASAQPTATDIFEKVQNQYFEALYLSKAGVSLSLFHTELTIIGFTGIFYKRTLIKGPGSVPS
jgi:DNA replication regulator SLD3